MFRLDIGEVIATIPPLKLGYGIVKVGNRKYKAETEFNRQIEEGSAVKILKKSKRILLVEPNFFSIDIKPFK